jgi:hypothetical protein
LAVKLCIDRTTGCVDCTGAQDEFVALQRVSAAARLQGVQCLTPVPIGCLEEEGILVTSWETGIPMTSRLIAAFKRRQETQQIGRMAGEWLRAFHQLGAQPAQCNDFFKKLAAIDYRVSENKASKQNGVVSLALMFLKEHVRAASTVPMPVSWIHGDFKSDNLLVNQHGALALDVQLRHVNSVIYDITPFLLHLELMQWSWRGYLCRSRLDAAANGFLDAYVLSSATEWRLPIIWLKVEMLIQRCLSNEGATKGLHTIYRRHMLNQVLRQALQQLSKIG